MDSAASISCPNCRTILKSLTQIKIDQDKNDKKKIRFNFKFKRVKFKVFVDLNEHKTFSKYLCYLLGIDELRIKIIYKGKQCDHKMIMENIENNKNNKIEYAIMGSKQQVYTFGTRVRTEYSQRITQAQYQWAFAKFSIISWFQSIKESLRNMTFGDIIEFIVFTLSFLLQLVILYFKSLCNPAIGRDQ